MSPRASVIVPCRNERNFVCQFLDSVLAQDTQFPFEVIIADGMSTDGTLALLQEYQQQHPTIRVIQNPGQIASTALNLAIREAAGIYIIRMDVHSEYAPDYIQVCVETLESHPGVENVGGPARTKADGYFQQANQLAYHSPFAVGGASFHNIQFEGEVDTVPYGCWRKEFLEKIGLFDEALVRNQDDEMNLRINLAGGRVWQTPRAQSWYHPRGSIKALFIQYMQYGYWKIPVIRKHQKPASFRHLVPGLFVATLVMLATLSLFSVLARWAFAALLALYALAVGGASLLVCHPRERWRFLPVMPIVFSTYHIAYGYGFLHGILDFLILSKATKSKFTNLTR